MKDCLHEIISYQSETSLGSKTQVSLNGASTENGGIGSVRPIDHCSESGVSNHGNSAQRNMLREKQPPLCGEQSGIE